ncbi:MAG: hypothetical protein PWP06_209 [Candidatus Marinimicrobia bacterium]|jgi:hypothetical protein|nr:hypothetical protein [Candidatus Neomarinimicrobiota bacterium]
MSLNRWLRLGTVLVLLSGCAWFRGGEGPEEDEVFAGDSAEIALQNDLIQQEMNEITGSGNRDSVIQERDYPFVLNELSYELKKQGARIKYLESELKELKAQSSLWENPLKIYNKEIILQNGTSVFGKIMYQDSDILKIQTLIGYVVIPRDEVVRIVDNIPSSAIESPAVTQNQAAERLISAPTAETISPLELPDRPSPSAVNANCILVGNIRESTDLSGNRIFSGEVKNIGARRADFVKVTFVFRMNWSGETKTLTTFVKGSFMNYASGVSSDAALLPGATGRFTLNIPTSFGTFIGYSYSINWEEYD